MNKEYPYHKKIYTDGLKKDNLVGIRIYGNDLHLKTKKKITHDSSIMTAEPVAIKEAINEKEKKKQNKKTR